MATASINSTPSIKKYTSSFLYQLQAEWDEFMLEISHSTPKDNLVHHDETVLSFFFLVRMDSDTAKFFAFGNIQSA